MRVKYKRFLPRGSRVVNFRELMNILRMYGVFLPGYGAIQ